MIFGIVGLILLIVYHNRFEHMPDGVFEVCFFIGGLFLTVWLAVFLSILFSDTVSGTVKVTVGLVPVMILFVWHIVVHIKYPPDKKKNREE